MKKNQSEGIQTFCRGGRRFSPTWDSRSPLQRIANVMRQEGLTTRNISLRLGKPEQIVSNESQPHRDMLLSELYRWQAALHVPVAELLVEPGTEFSSTVLLRVRLLKLMRSVRSIQELSKEDSTQSFARLLIKQLMEMMPELEGVSSWPAIGQRREAHELGEICKNVIPAQMFKDYAEDI